MPTLSFLSAFLRPRITNQTPSSFRGGGELSTVRKKLDFISVTIGLFLSIFYDKIEENGQDRGTGELWVFWTRELFGANNDWR